MPLPPANAQYVRAAFGIRRRRRSDRSAAALPACRRREGFGRGDRDMLPRSCNAHADAQMALVRRAADRVRAPHFLAVDRARARRCAAPARKRIRVAQLLRHFERHAQRRRSPPGAVSDGQRMVGQHAQRSQMHLKYSNGSRQLVQRYSALHGVDPNSLTRSRLLRRAARTVHGRLAPQAARAVDGFSRGRDAVLAQLLARALGEPVAGPGRREHRVDADGCKAGLLQVFLDRRLDHFGRGATRVRRRHADRDAALLLVAHVTHDAELDHVQDRNLRVRHLGEQLAKPSALRTERERCYHCAPGYVRCMNCISASSRLRCSLC